MSRQLLRELESSLPSMYAESKERTRNPQKVCNVFVESNCDFVRGKKDTHKSPFNAWQKERERKEKRKTVSVFSTNSLQGGYRSNYQPVTRGGWPSVRLRL